MSAQDADRADDSVEPGVWRYATASRVRVIIDAQDYFDLMQQAMLKARQRVFLISWDFDTRIHLTRGRRWWQKVSRRHEYPARLGAFIIWLTKHCNDVEIRVLNWNFGLLKSVTRGSMLVDLLTWLRHPRIDFKFDRAHPTGCSHHQKIVLVDDALAVCGGIDMSDRRWDTREHLEHDARRQRPGGKPYNPWHDITMMMEGPIASALGDLGERRWELAGGRPLPKLHPSDATAWPDGLKPHFENVEVGIARTRAAYGECPQVGEIEALFLSQIARAKHFIYAENQYFASRVIGEALAKRMAEENPPEVIVVQPITSDGWVESAVMNPARALLVRAIREVDHKGRFHIYTPFAGDTPIYVHAKVTIVDDEILRVGSANFNNRSMRLDSECDAFIDCTRPANGHCIDGIRALRYSLLAEHLGLGEDEVEPLLAEAGSMSALIASLEGGRKPRKLIAYQPEELTTLEIDLANREAFDPEDPAAIFRMAGPERGLFRPGSLLARSMNRLKRKQPRP